MSESPYVVAYACEEETSLSHMGGRQADELDLRTALTIYNRRLFREHGIVTHGRLDSTGGGKYLDNTHVELTTATCTSIQDVVLRSQAHEPTLVEIGDILLDLTWRSGSEAVFVDRRNVDSRGNTYACHDNNGVNTNRDPETLTRELMPIMIGHTLTRGCITGAGYCGVNPSDKPSVLYFAQKVNKIAGVTTYGHKSSIFRVSGSEGKKTKRIEVRCSDVNLSPDATAMRIGAMPLP